MFGFRLFWLNLMGMNTILWTEHLIQFISAASEKPCTQSLSVYCGEDWVGSLDYHYVDCKDFVEEINKEFRNRPQYNNTDVGEGYIPREFEMSAISHHPAPTPLYDAVLKDSTKVNSSDASCGCTFLKMG